MVVDIHLSELAADAVLLEVAAAAATAAVYVEWPTRPRPRPHSASQQSP
jgi:hypothetical protein